jgi:serine protein kinase
MDNDFNSLSNQSLQNHIKNVVSGDRRFENIYQSLTRLILGSPDNLKKVNINGKSTFDFLVFRNGKRHIVGMHDELNSFVSYVKDAAENGSSKEMSFVLIGEPGNGKTFFVDYLSKLYRNFISLPENNRFTFQFKNLDQLGNYGALNRIESQTFEDPMVLAMNLFDSKDENIDFIQKLGASDKQIEELYENYRPLGACSDYILQELRDHTEFNLDKLLINHIDIVKIPISESRGTLTGKYAAKDKITSSAVDLLGEESISRLLHITDTNNPYRFDLRRGALARVAGGGIHFADEIFKNKKDLVQVYLGVIQNRLSKWKVLSGRWIL